MHFECDSPDYSARGTVNFLNFLNFLNFSGFLEPFPSENTLGIVHFIGRKRGKCAGF